jgi:hypothetical protein
VPKAKELKDEVIRMKKLVNGELKAKKLKNNERTEMKC